MNETYILAVDDEQSILDLVVRILKKDGYKLTLARSAEEALALMKPTPDLIITDVNMGKDRMKGTDFVHHLRAQGITTLAGNPVPVIVLSTEVDEDFITRLAEPHVEALTKGTEGFVTRLREIVAKMLPPSSRPPDAPV
jgi:CheY-like chemotaxis protein